MRFVDKFNQIITKAYKENPKAKLIIKLYPAQIHDLIQYLQDIRVADYNNFIRLSSGELDFIFYQGIKICIEKADEKIILIDNDQ